MPEYPWSQCFESRCPTLREKHCFPFSARLIRACSCPCLRFQLSCWTRWNHCNCHKHFPCDKEELLAAATGAAKDELLAAATAEDEVLTSAAAAAAKGELAAAAKD